MRSAFVVAAVLLGLVGGVGHAEAASAWDGQFVSLDHVVAVVNGEVLLESDVDAETHFAALEPFQQRAAHDTQQNAMRRLISRALIVQQMNEQQFKANISDAEVEKSLTDLRSHLPQCAKYNCTTAAGWEAFLAANDLTEQEVTKHWKQRMAILKFIDARFRTGIRISSTSVADYYTKSVVPVFERQNQKAPPLKALSGRIQEMLLQQQVSAQLQDWLKSLRDEGSLRILDPAYAPLASTSDGSGASGEESSE
jgi:hypothetical protein